MEPAPVLLSEALQPCTASAQFAHCGDDRDLLLGPHPPGGGTHDIHRHGAYTARHARGLVFRHFLRGRNRWLPHARAVAARRPVRSVSPACLSAPLRAAPYCHRLTISLPVAAVQITIGSSWPTITRTGCAPVAQNTSLGSEPSRATTRSRFPLGTATA
jgi:hypothetical protein